ncbi:hypothetical protein PENSPDRAFT_690688 [Peniophora sp. CONT]|nr:hypothetical protein PENSPDRAFT_690688 [Peniophora sp. CONT]
MHRAATHIRRQSLSTTVARESSAILSASATDAGTIDAFDLPYHIGDASSPLVGYSHSRRLSSKAASPLPAKPAALLFDGPALTKQGRAPSRPHATSLGPVLKFDGPSRSRHAGTERVIVEPTPPRMAPSQTLLPDWCKTKLAQLEGVIESTYTAPELASAV